MLCLPGISSGELLLFCQTVRQVLGPILHRTEERTDDRKQRFRTQACMGCDGTVRLSELALSDVSGAIWVGGQASSAFRGSREVRRGP